MTYEKHTIYTNGVVAIVDKGEEYAGVFHVALNGMPKGPAFAYIPVWDHHNECRSEYAERDILDTLAIYPTYESTIQ